MFAFHWRIQSNLKAITNLMADFIDASSVVDDASPVSSEESTEVQAEPSAVEDTTTTETNSTEQVGDALPDSSEKQTTEPKEQIFDNSGEETKTQAKAQVNWDELSEDDKILAIREFAKDNNTPQFARDKLLSSLNVFDEAIKGHTDLKNRYNDLELKAKDFENKQVLSQADQERFTQMEESLLGVQSLAAKPQDIHEFIKNQNPRVYDQFVQDTVWNALEHKDGSLNEGTLQQLIDKQTGFNPSDENTQRVDAKDVLQSINRLKKDKDFQKELYDFRTDEEEEAFNNARKLEQETLRRDAESKARAEKLEIDQRTNFVSKQSQHFQTEIREQINPLIDKFNLGYVENEPAMLSSFKQKTRQQLFHVVQNAVQTNPHFKNLEVATAMLKEPQGNKSDEVELELNSYFNSSPYKASLKAGMTAMMEQIEQVVAQNAAEYTALAKGYEVLEKERIKKARTTPKSPNQIPESDEDLSKLSPNERNARIAEQMTAQFRNASNANPIG